MRSNFQTGACHQLLSSNHYFTGKKRELCRRSATLSPAADTCVCVGGFWKGGGGGVACMQLRSKSGSRSGAVTHAGAFYFLPRRRSSCGVAGDARRHLQPSSGKSDTLGPFFRREYENNPVQRCPSLLCEGVSQQPSRRD